MPSESKRISGPIVVLLVFFGALLLAMALFLVAYQHKLKIRGNRHEASTPGAVRSWMAALPRDWMQISFVDGKRYVLYTPCYTPASELTLSAPYDNPPTLICEDCDSIPEREVRSIRRNPDSSLRFLLAPEVQAKIEILPVNDALLTRFPGAPFRDKILLWIIPQGTLLWAAPRDGRETAGDGGDTLIFAPKSQADAFETLRAEDENPEGCGDQGE